METIKRSEAFHLGSREVYIQAYDPIPGEETPPPELPKQSVLLESSIHNDIQFIEEGVEAGPKKILMPTQVDATTTNSKILIATALGRAYRNQIRTVAIPVDLATFGEFGRDEMPLFNRLSAIIRGLEKHVKGFPATSVKSIIILTTSKSFDLAVRTLPLVLLKKEDEK